MVNSYLVPAGGTVALWDADAGTMWLKSKEPNGIVQNVRKFRMEEVKEPPPEQTANSPTREEFDELKAMIAKIASSMAQGGEKK